MPTRPKHASASHIKDLLQNHVFVPDLPADVADAVLSILIDRGFFEIDGEHHEVSGQPGLTLQPPDKAGAGIWRALGAFTSRTEGAKVLQRVIRGSGASGSGAGGGRVDPAALRAAQAKAAARDLAEFEWRRVELVESLAPDNPNAGTLVLDFLIDQAREPSFVETTSQPEPVTAARKPDCSHSPETGSHPYSFINEGDVWRVAFGTEKTRVSKARGFDHIVRLLEKPGMPIPAVELQQAGSAPAPRHRKAADPQPIDRDDSPARSGHGYLDDKREQKHQCARAETELREIAEELEKARKDNDPAAVERLEEDLDRMCATLAAVRSRASDEKESAANAVRNAIDRAVRKLEKELPKGGNHLRERIRKGANPVYFPDPEITWMIAR